MAKVKHLEGLADNEIYIKLSDKLLRHELYASRKGKGVWKLPPVTEQVKTYFREKYTNMMTPVHRLLNRFDRKKE